jgi:hypothetical protein
MPILQKLENPTPEVMRRVQEINRQETVPPAADAPMDEKELAEREEAARAYAGEDEPHFVSFVEDCVDTAVRAMQQIRLDQQECWDVFNEEQPPNYARKEAWQSKVVVPKPFGSVQFSMAIVRKAFDTQFLSVENERDDETAQFWQKLLGYQLSRNYANFPINFTDAVGMGFAIGQSMEMIPVWRPGKGLRYVLVEPWKIHRDPDALSRQPQSGLYWVHQEYLDYWLLKDYAKKGRYINIGTWGPGGAPQEGNPKDPSLTKEEIARRKNQVWGRSRFRSMVLTSEFYGTVLDRNGELLLPNATYTTAAGRVIKLPQRSPYPTLRWPGMGFSPFPHLLRFDGRGLVKGVKSLWYFLNSLMCLQADNLNWIVNPPSEIDISTLVDPTDIDDFPGKQWLTRGTTSGQQAVRMVERKSNTSEFLAHANFIDQRMQEGMMLNYTAQGLPGYRAEVTAWEASQNLEQSMTVFGLIGKNLEDGALNSILAGAETIAINITFEELAAIMGEEVATKYQVPVDADNPTGIKLPTLTTGTFRVSGISALMRDLEIIHNIRDIVLPMFQDPLFQPYGKPYALCQSVEKRLNLRDEGLWVDPAMAQKVDEAQQAQQEASIETQKALGAAEAALTQAKAEAERAKALMNEAKAMEHEGKGFLAKAKAVTELAPGEGAHPGEQPGGQPGKKPGEGATQ